MTWSQLLWSLLPWWGWLGVLLMVVSVVWGLAWFWLDLVWSSFRGRGFVLVLTLAAIGSTLLLFGSQHEMEPLRLQPYRPPAPEVQQPKQRRAGLLKWLLKKYRDNKELF